MTTKLTLQSEVKIGDTIKMIGTSGRQVGTIEVISVDALRLSSGKLRFQFIKGVSKRGAVWKLELNPRGLSAHQVTWNADRWVNVDASRCTLHAA